MVLVDAVTHTADCVQSAFDVVFGVPVDQASFQIEVVLADLLFVTQVEVDIVTFFRAQAGLSGLKVLISEKFVGGGQPVCFLVREFCLQAVDDEIGSGRSVSE